MQIKFKAIFHYNNLRLRNTHRFNFIFKSIKYFARVFDHDWFLSFNREIAFSYLAGALISTVFSILFSLLFYASAAVSDQLKNARLTSSNSASHLRGLHSVHPTSGSLHAQDPLEAALLAAARGQHGTGIPGKVYWSRSVGLMKNRNLRGQRYQSEQLLQAAERSDSSSVTVFRFCSFSQLFHGNASFVIFLWYHCYSKYLLTIFLLW